MNFISYPPHPALKNYIQCYGHLSFSKLDSLRIDHTPSLIGKSIMFWFSYSPIYFTNGLKIEGVPPLASIVAQGTRSHVLRHQGDLEIFCVAFWPGKMREMFRFPWFELLDDYLDLFDSEDQRLMDWGKRIIDAKTLAERIGLSNAYFLKRLPFHQAGVDLIQHSLGIFLK